MAVSVSPMHQRVDAVKQALGVDVCSLYQALEDQQTLEIVASSGLNQNALGSRLSWQQGLTGRVARTGAPVAARDISTHADNFHIDGSDEEQFKSYLGIPLKENGALYGVLVIQTTDKRTFFQRDVRELYNAGHELMCALAGRAAEV